MSTWQIGESGTEVALDDQGRGEVTFTVTNTGAAQDRSVLTVTALDGAAESWFSVEEPQRLVPPGQSAAYLCKVQVPAGTAAGAYALQAVAYSADRDPGETSTTSRRVTMTVAATAKPPSGTPWWAFLITALVLLTVIAVILWLVLKDDGFGNEEPPTIEGTPEVLETLTATPGTWSEEEGLVLAFQWQRCDAEGEGCEPIDGATLPAYQVGADDLALTLRVEVTATVEEDSASATSDPTDPVAPTTVTPVPVPNVVGLPLSTAVSELSANFQVVTLTAGDAANNCNPPVESQAPVGGAQLDPGEQVTISSRPRGGPLVFCFDRGILELPILLDEQFTISLDDLEDLGGG